MSTTNWARRGGKRVTGAQYWEIYFDISERVPWKRCQFEIWGESFARSRCCLPGDNPLCPDIVTAVNTRTNQSDNPTEYSGSRCWYLWRIPRKMASANQLLHLATVFLRRKTENPLEFPLIAKVDKFSFNKPAIFTRFNVYLRFDSY